ncbi:CBM35 domain-containing protein [Fibrobacter sp. UBA4309]|uniref:pectate lyase family protein n=1 Tax=Fibrobacter sp. UBA4309 TaxID=1946537 RepID=UPI0025C36908|nr:CBM35 domain-containing protein [Fibrobacter sp. UBA4309]
MKILNQKWSVLPVLFLVMVPVLSMAAVDQCKPIGWATRSGRTSTPFEVTGGGNAAPITVTTLADLQKYAKDSSPRVIYIDGTLGDGWNGKSGDRVDITGSNKTIIGLRPGTELKAVVYIKKASNIILRNIVIKGPGSNADQAWDNFNIENAQNIWVDHCEFWDGQDGNADVVKGADNVTFTWCKFGYTRKSTHNLSNLIASSDDEPASVGKLNITFMFNWWVAANQRKPRCRYGNVHVINNLYTGNSSITAGTAVLGVSAGVQCHVRTEKNVFIDENDPIYNGNNTDGSGGNEVIDNIFTRCSGNTKGQGTSFTPPYDYSFALPASEVEAAVRAGAGANLNSPTECDANYVEPPPPTPDKQYQADKGTATNSFIETTNAGYHGDAYVNFDKGGSVIVPVKVDVAGEYKFEIDFANGSSEDRSLVISSAIDTATSVFEKTGAWNTWKTQEVSLMLTAGENSVKFATLDGSDGPNIDQFDVTLVKAAIDTSGTDAVPLLAGASLLSNVCDVSIYGIDGRFVRSQKNFPQSSLRNSGELLSGLRAGVYLVRTTAPGAYRQFFAAAK